MKREGSLHDDELVSMFVGGNEAAFHALVTRYKRYLLIICYKYTKNVDTSKDLAQETYIRMFMYLKQGKYYNKENTKNNFRNWMIRIAVNCFIDQGRSKIWREKAVLIANDCGSINESIVLDRVQNSCLSHLFVSDIHTILQSMLSPDHYKVFALYIQEYQHQEIAELLSIPIGTVKTRIYTARSRVQKGLAHYR